MTLVFKSHIPALTMLAALVVSCGGQPSIDVDASTKIAGELRNNKLFEAAIEEYRRILDAPSLDKAQRGNVNYLIARIYFEDVRDYPNAAAYYVRARAIDPQASYVEEASRNLIVALEKMGRTIDAVRELRSAVDVDRQAEPASGDVVVARVGDRTYYMSEIEDRIQNLPRDLQEQLSARSSRVDFVRQLAGVELLYRAAVREGYDRKPDIQKQVEDYTRRAVVDRFLVERVMGELNIDTMDVHTFYKAFRDERYNGLPYDSVRSRVMMDYQQEKAEAAYNEYLRRLAKAERFEILESNVR